MQNKEDEKGLLLGLSIIAVLVLFMFLPFGEESAQEVGKNLQTVITGIYLQFVGFLFVVSYFFPHKSFLFRWLMLFCGSKSPVLNVRNITLVYFLLCFGIGTYFLVIGLGGI